MTLTLTLTLGVVDDAKVDPASNAKPGGWLDRSLTKRLLSPKQSYLPRRTLTPKMLLRLYDVLELLNSLINKCQDI